MAFTTPLTASVAFSIEELYSVLSDTDRVSTGRSPEFFLASLPAGAQPRLAVVRDQLGAVAVICGGERTICGFRTGAVDVDATLATESNESGYSRAAIYEAAARAFGRLPGVRSVRFLLDDEDAPAFDGLRSAAEITGANIEVTAEIRHCSLAVPPSYEAFLDRLDAEDAEYYRACRQNSDALGYRYVSHVPLTAFRHAGWEMIERGATGAEAEAVRQAIAMAEAAENPLLVGIRSERGEWLAIAAGWYEGERAIVALALHNDREYAAYSLDVVLRGFLVEQLAETGVSYLILRNAAGQILNNDAEPVPNLAVQVESRMSLAFAWRTVTRLVRSAIWRRAAANEYTSFGSQV